MTSVRYHGPEKDFLSMVDKSDETNPALVKAAIEIDLPRLNVLPTRQGDEKTIKERFNPEEIKSYSQGGMVAGCANYLKSGLSDEMKITFLGDCEVNFAYVDASGTMRGVTMMHSNVDPGVWMIATTANFDLDEKDRTVDVFSSEHFFEAFKTDAHKSSVKFPKIKALILESINSKELTNILGADFLITDKSSVIKLNPKCLERLKVFISQGLIRMDMLGPTLGGVFVGSFDEKREALKDLEIGKIDKHPARVRIMQEYASILAPSFIEFYESNLLTEKEKNKCRYLISRMQEPIIMELRDLIKSYKQNGPGFFNASSHAIKITAAEKLLNYIVSEGSPRRDGIRFSATELKSLTEPGSELGVITGNLFIFLPLSLRRDLQSSLSPGKTLGR